MGPSLQLKLEANAGRLKPTEADRTFHCRHGLRTVGAETASFHGVATRGGATGQATAPLPDGRGTDWCSNWREGTADGYAI